MYNFLKPFDFGRNLFGDFDSAMSNRGVLKLNAENKDRKYTRSYALPDISDEEIAAKLENGILTVSIPKKEPVKKLIKIS